MIRLQSVQTADIPQLCDELGNQAEFKRAFPTIKRGAFQRSVLSVHQLHDGKDVAGFLLKTVPSIPFKAYGDRESLLLIYPEYQRQGIGTRVLNLIHQDKKPIFFVSSKSNPASTAFFQKQSSLALVDETDRYKVYTSKNQ